MANRKHTVDMHRRAAAVTSILRGLGKSTEKRVVPSTRKAKTHRRIESTTPSPYDPDVRRYGIALGKASREEW